MTSGPHSRRRLSKEEIALWLQVTRTIAPRPGVCAPEAEVETAATAPAKPETEKRATSHPAPKAAKGAYRPLALPLAPIERRLRQRLSRGQIAIDMKIDLHGMRQAEAHTALRGFLTRARQGEAKVVLVVTGKGNGKAREEAGAWSEGGVLRRTVPQWLAAPDLRHVVLGFEEAAPSHGGSGALYVRLRGKRGSEGAHG